MYIRANHFFEYIKVRFREWHVAKNQIGLYSIQTTKLKFARVYYVCSHFYKDKSLLLQKQLFFSVSYFLTENIWRLSIKVVTLHADTGSDQETTETNAANSIHTHGNDGNECVLHSFFDLRDNCQ